MDNNFLAELLQLPLKRAYVCVLCTVLFCFLLPVPVFSSPVPSLDYLSNYSFTTLPLPPVLSKGAPRIRQLGDEALPWKDLWEKARALARQGDLAEAADSYKRLYLVKKIAEARWELASVLASLGEDEQAYEIVEGLYEEYAERLDYVNALAVLAMRTKHYERGAELFAKLLQLDLKNENAMAGAAYGFLVAEKDKEALPFLQLLWQKGTYDNRLRELIILTACQGGEVQIAESFLKGWSAPKADSAIIRCAAVTYQSLGKTKQAAEYWGQLLAQQPGDVDAHRNLAVYYDQVGDVGERLVHLLALYKKNPNKSQLLKQIGQCYVGLKQFDQALSYFEQYIKQEPDDKGAVRFVVNIHAALGDKSETLRALEHYFTIESHPDKEQLGKAAVLYGEKGYYQQAIDIYRRMLDISPDDPEILVGLANNFMQIGSEEEALAVWKQLAEIVPDVVDVYLPMADLLERMGRCHEFIDVMEVVYELKPTDISVVTRLAGAYVAAGDDRHAGLLLNKFSGLQAFRADFLALRAGVNYRLEDFAAAVTDFEQLLTLDPGNEQARLDCLIAYGRLGDQAMVRKHFTLLGSSVDLLPAHRRLELAVAFADSGLLGWARGQVRLLVDQYKRGEGGVDALIVGQAVILAAKTYEDEGLLYEAEQCLRKGLVLVGQPQKICPALFTIALKRGRLNEAQSWLGYLRRVGGNSNTADLLTAELLAARGQFRQFRSMVTDLRQGLSAGHNQDYEAVQQLTLLASCLAKYGQLHEAGEIAAQILSDDPKAIEALVIVQKAHGEGVYFSDDLGGGIVWDKLPRAHKIAVVRLYQRYEMFKDMENAAQKIVAEYPGSFVGRMLLAQSLLKQHKLAQAKDELLVLFGDFPDNEALLARLAHISFIMGDLDGSLSYCRALQGELRPDIILLTARILWMQNKWDESLNAYSSILQPPIFAALAARSELAGVILPVDDERYSWLELFGLSPDNQFAGQTAVNPEFMLSLLGGNNALYLFNLAMAGDYAKYRWQEQFAVELQARNYVKRQEYYLAAKQFEYLLFRYPYLNTESLALDLAEVQGRLGDIADEESVYVDLVADNVAFPALPELAGRNRLRRRPHAEAFTGYSKDEGRDDYINMQKDWSGAAFLFSPQTRHEATLELSRVNYHSTVSNDVMRSSKAVASYQANVFTGLTLALRGGWESIEDSGVDNILLMAEGLGQIGDKLTGSVSYERGLIYDTVASIRRDITAQTLAGSLLFEPMARLALEGDYFATDYSDNNWTTGYDLKAGYVLLSEPTFLKISYSYEFKESEDSAMPGVPTDDGFALDDHPYWSPKNYWLNQFGAEFKHLLSADSMGKWTSDRYYTAEYYLGHDSDGYAVQTVKGGLYYAVNDSFNLQATGALVTSTPYRKKELLLSVDYRW